jgi:hypothetical protein
MFIIAYKDNRRHGDCTFEEHYEEGRAKLMAEKIIADGVSQKVHLCRAFATVSSIAKWDEDKTPKT